APSRPAKRFDWSNLGVRLASGFTLGPLAIAAVWFGGWLFLLMLAVGAALLAHEWAQMSAPSAPKRFSFGLLIAVLPGVLLAYVHRPELAWTYLAVAAVSFGAVARLLGYRIADAVLGVVYLASPLVALMWLREQSAAGRGWTTLLFAVTWGADIGAYVVGNWLKGPKLWPRLSPSKTWSGAAGGLATAMIAAILVSQISTVHAPILIAAAVGLIGGLATICGDLFESSIKRHYGVKDSGDVIPGHGGFLDRVDGLMVAILAVAGMRLVLQYWDVL
ncbi:MAG: phosphatidate cytidylyltransferase, partial [Caulobacteraceae bacterium]